MQKREALHSAKTREGVDQEANVHDVSCKHDGPVLLTLQIPVLARLDGIVQILFSAGLIADVLPRLWERDPQEGRTRQDELAQLTYRALVEVRKLLLEMRIAELVEGDPNSAFINKES